MQTSMLRGLTFGCFVFATSAGMECDVRKTWLESHDWEGIEMLQIQAKKACDGEDRTKLLINSNAHYDIARNKLLASLVNSGFSSFCDVIVVLGGSQADSEPYTPSDEYGKRGVTYIDVKLDSFDYHGFSGLYYHREHPRVKAGRYMFIHDTVLVNKSFPEAFNSFSWVGPDEIYHSPAPFSNICVIGRKVVDSWNSNFDCPLTKAQAVALEFGREQFCNEQLVLPLSFFGKNKEGRERIDTGLNIDLYGTGYPRKAIYYPEFSLTKYFLFNRYGDLQGNLQGTFDAMMLQLGQFNRSDIHKVLGVPMPASGLREAPGVINQTPGTETPMTDYVILEMLKFAKEPKTLEICGQAGVVKNENAEGEPKFMVRGLDLKSASSVETAVVKFEDGSEEKLTINIEKVC